MIRTSSLAATALLAAILGTALHTPAHALSMKECSTKFKEAKQAGTLGGQSWKEFRSAQCTSAASAKASSTATTSSTTASAPGAKPGAPIGGATGSAVFPNAIDPKYAKEAAGKARMHTCLDQYHANKTNNGNGGMKWIQKGGGYFSQCTKRLKGAA